MTSPITGKLLAKEYINALYNRIKELHTLFDTNPRSKIVGSSLFFVGARDYYHEADAYSQSIEILQVYLIDMGHMEVLTQEGEKDTGFLHGLEGIMKILGGLSDDYNI